MENTVIPFLDSLSRYEFLIQAGIDLHMQTQNGQWGFCWKALITFEAWQQLFFPPFIWSSVTVQMEVIFQLYRALSPQQGSNIESALKKKERERKKPLGSKPRLSFGNKICHVNTRSIYQTSNW